MHEFLGPNNTGSIIMMHKVPGRTLPTPESIRKLYRLKEGTTYRCDKYYREINQLQELKQALSEYHMLHVSPRAYDCEVYFYTESKINFHSYLELKYSDAIIAGFNLTTDCLEELRDLLAFHQHLKASRKRPHQFIENLKDIAEKSSDFGCIDRTMTCPPIDELERIFQQFGDQAYKDNCNRLQIWHDTYIWKV